MKKPLLFLSLFIFWVTLAWCSNQIVETAEQECVDNDWEVTTDELWNNICLFNAHERCQISEIEAWTCGWLNNEFDDSDYPEYSDYIDPACSLKVELVCPEWIDKCYEDMHAWYDIICPKRDELFGCEYKEVEVCG